MRIVLASGSASRKSILESAGITPILRPANVDEDAIIADHAATNADPEDIVLALAQAKATIIAANHPHDLVIGADSMLLLDGELQGKPHTEAETIKRWQHQRGKIAQLITGHHIIAPRGPHDGVQNSPHTTHKHTTQTEVTAAYYATVATTTVQFAADITDADIVAYAATGEPLPCAGAFTLEALGGWFIDRIEGDPSNVIGLSLPVIRRALYHFGYDVHDFWNRRKAE